MGATNTLTAILPKILARGLQVLRTRCIMPRLVNSDFGIEAAQKGTTISVPVPVDVGTTSVTAAQTKPTPTGLATSVKSIILSEWQQTNPVVLTDKELGDIDAKKDFLPMAIEGGIKALATYVNQAIWADYKSANGGIYTVAGAAYGTTPFDATYQGQNGAVLARKALNTNLALRSDRRGVVDFDAEANMLNLAAFSDAEKIMSAVVKIEGDIGRKFGIDWVADDDCVEHTAGTLSSPVGTVDVSATEPVGETEIAIASTSASDDGKTVKAGDIVTFDTHTQTYVVTELVTMSGQAAVVKIYPGLTVEVAAGNNTVIDVKASHVINLAFHRDAFAFANRPLRDPITEGLGPKVMSLQDPFTGLTLRMEVTRTHKQVTWETDILFGSELVRPELATRIIGQSS